MRNAQQNQEGKASMTGKPTLATTARAPNADNQNALTAGPRGPVLMPDYQLLEKLARRAAKHDDSE